MIRRQGGAELIGVFLVLALLGALVQAGSPGFNLAEDGVWSIAKYFPREQRQRIEEKQKQGRGKKQAEELGRDQAVPVAADIPNLYLGLYQAYAPSWWPVVAGVYKVESNHGQSRAPGVRSGVNSFGCCAGPGQFNLGGTWQRWRSNPKANVYDPRAAVPATARMLRWWMRQPVTRTCSVSDGHGYSARVVNAVRFYNNACSYVDSVLAWARVYAKAPPKITFTRTHGCDPAKDWRRRRLSAETRGFMLKLATRFSFRVSCIRSGHSRNVKGTGRESAHWSGRAFDVDQINGKRVTSFSSGFGSQALAYGAKQVGGPVDLCAGSRCFTDSGHQRHWHVQP